MRACGRGAVRERKQQTPEGYPVTSPACHWPLAPAVRGVSPTLMAPLPVQFGLERAPHLPSDKSASRPNNPPNHHTTTTDHRQPRGCALHGKSRDTRLSERPHPDLTCPSRTLGAPGPQNQRKRYGASASAALEYILMPIRPPPPSRSFTATARARDSKRDPPKISNEFSVPSKWLGLLGSTPVVPPGAPTPPGSDTNFPSAWVLGAFASEQVKFSCGPPCCAIAR